MTYSKGMRGRLRRTVTRATCAARAAAGVLRHRVGGIPRPVLVGIDVTNQCNLSCQYCHREALAEREELDTASATALLSRLVQAGMRVAVLSGGEPLTREDLPALLDPLRGAGVFVAVNTNGALLPRRIDVMDRLDLAKISFDGPEDVHDALRGKGSHAAAMRGVEAARRRCLPVKLNCTLTRHNVARVEEILTFCREQDLAIKFQPVSGAHAAGDDAAHLAPERPSYLRALDAIRRDKARSGSPVVNSHAALRHQATWPHGAPISCAAGRVYGRVDLQGRLYPCTMRQFEGPFVELAGRPIHEAMAEVAVAGCAACWCSSTMELNLLLDGNLGAALAERNALWRGGGRG